MSVEDTVKALRAISQDYENGNDGTSFDVCGECKNAADQLERMNDFQNSQCTKLMEKIAVLESENERLKAEKPVQCGECIHIFERHYEDEFEPPYIKYGCKYRGNYQVFLNDFCSYGERQGAE